MIAKLYKVTQRIERVETQLKVMKATNAPPLLIALTIERIAV